jgi:Bacteriophage Lambda NinG protein
MNPIKQHKCKVCKSTYTKSRSTQTVCGAACAIAIGRAVTAKNLAKEKVEDAKATRAKLDDMKTKPQLLKLAQAAFNKFIRTRDAGKPCICCGKPLTNESNSFDAGHYRSVGSAPHMRFVEDNVHGQLKHCNNYLAGNHVRYRQGLIERIGLDRVEQLEADQTLRKYTHEGLRAMAIQYRSMTKQLKVANGL